MATGLDLIDGKTAACRYCYTNVINAGGKILTAPQRGCLVFYDWNPVSQWNHIGICEGGSNSAIIDIEGNTSDAVLRRTRSEYAGYKVAYVMPAYESSDQIEKVLSIAAGEIGTNEIPINQVKYNDWYYGQNVNGDAYPWCNAFISWIFWMLGEGASGGGTSSTVSDNSTDGVQYTVTTNTSPLNIRSSPGGAVIGSYAKGSNIYVTEFSGSWAKTSRGWVSLDFITKTGTGSLPSGSTQMYEIGKVYTTRVSNLNVRFGAGISSTKKAKSQLTQDGQKNSDSYGRLNKGVSVTCFSVIMIDNDIWMKIPSGWVAAYYQGKRYIA